MVILQLYYRHNRVAKTPLSNASYVHLNINIGIFYMKQNCKKLIIWIVLAILFLPVRGIPQSLHMTSKIEKVHWGGQLRVHV